MNRTLPSRQVTSIIQLHDEQSSTIETLESGRVMARALADSIDGCNRLALARTFGASLIRAWWRALTPTDEPSFMLRKPLQSFETIDLPVAAEVLADSLGKSAALCNPETAAYHIGLIYTSTLPPAHRALHGIYYTPPCLVDRLIAQATACGVDWTSCRVLDPACGGGAFLAPIARRILDQLTDCSPRILIENMANRLRGYELDPFGAWLSQVTIDAVMLPITHATGSQFPVVVTVCDSLRKEPPRELFDLVIGNPPYGRVSLDTETRTYFNRCLFGHANLYGLFSDIALRHARPGGVVAYLTPTSFLAGEYFKNLRSLLIQDAPPATLDFVSTRKGVFEDVLQETLLATYKRTTTRAPVTSLVKVNEIIPLNGTVLTVKDIGDFELPKEPSKPWILPRCAEQAPLAALLSRMKHRLADWGYTVSTGPLVWNRHKHQLVHGSGQDRYPLIWAEAITSDGQFVWRAEKRNHTLWFEIRNKNDWLVTRSECVLLQRTTAKEQNRRLIAAALPSAFLDKHGAVIVENHLNMLKPIVDKQKIPVAALAAFLNSTVTDQAFRCVSGSVAVSAYELESLPLPAPESLHILTDLVRNSANQTMIDTECLRLYSEIV